MKTKVYSFYSLTKRAFIQVTAQNKKHVKLYAKNILHENLQLYEISILRTVNSQQESIETAYPEIF